MSRVHDILRTDKESTLPTWYVKTHDGSTYGPVDLATLCDWATQSRVAPGNLISDNGADWIQAEDIPDLKMEWQAHLPDGRICGPFNVLAVPHLVQNGILPAESSLVNRLTNKTLQVRELLKPSATASNTHNAEPGEPIPGEQSCIRANPPLINQAEAQRTIDKLTTPSTIQTESITSDHLTATEELDKPESDESQPESRVQQLKEYLFKLHRNAEELQARLDLAEKNLLAQKGENESLARQMAVKEEQFRQRFQEMDSELKTTSSELALARQRTPEDARTSETIARQAQKKEQDLSRALEETRRKAEADAALLFKLKAQAEELKNQKTEAQARAASEEARLKIQIQALEKQVHILNTEIQTQKTQHQSTEKDLIAKHDRLLAQAAQLKEKADSAASELERLKKELERQKSLFVDLEKNSIEKESSLVLDTRSAKSAMVKAENELAAFKKQHELLKTQSSHKESELLHRVDQLNNESRNSASTVDNLRKELASQVDEYRKLDKRSRNLDLDQERSVGAIKQLQEERIALETKTRKATEETARLRSELESEKNSHTELRNRYQEEKTQLVSRLEQIQSENKNLQTRMQDAEKQFAGQKQETDRVRSLVTSKDEQSNRQLEQLKNELQASKNELASIRQKHTEERRNLEMQVKQSSSKEQEAGRIHEDTSKLLESKSSQLERTSNELRDALSSLNQLREQHSKLAQKETRVDVSSPSADRIAALQDQANKFRQESEDLKEQLESEKAFCLDLASTASKKESTLQKKTDELQNEIGSLKSELENEKKQASGLKQDLSARNSELEQKTSDLTKQAEKALEEERKRNKALTRKVRRLQTGRPDVETPEQTDSDVFLQESSLDRIFDRYSNSAKVGVAVILIAICSAAAFFAGMNASSIGRRELKPVEHTALTPAVAVPVKQPATTSPTIAAPAPQIKQKQPLPKFKIDKVNSIYGEDSCKFVFDFGVFSFMTNIQSEAISTLGVLASQIRQSIGDYKLIIEGHTDTVKVSSAASVQGNYELGLARANKVMDLLRTRFNIPPESMVATSTGENDPPFPNTDTLRKKNRTVVLKLAPK